MVGGSRSLCRPTLRLFGCHRQGRRHLVVDAALRHQRRGRFLSLALFLGQTRRPPQPQLYFFAAALPIAGESPSVRASADLPGFAFRHLSLAPALTMAAAWLGPCACDSADWARIARNECGRGRSRSYSKRYQYCRCINWWARRRCLDGHTYFDSVKFMEWTTDFYAKLLLGERWILPAALMRHYRLTRRRAFRRQHCVRLLQGRRWPWAAAMPEQNETVML